MVPESTCPFAISSWYIRNIINRHSQELVDRVSAIRNHKDLSFQFILTVFNFLNARQHLTLARTKTRHHHTLSQTRRRSSTSMSILRLLTPSSISFSTAPSPTATTLILHVPAYGIMYLPRPRLEHEDENDDNDRGRMY